MIGATILTGDCRTVLRELPEASVHCCVTSPPYWGLRDYGVAGQIGREESPEAYVKTICEVFSEVWRVLRDDGTVWLNLGDCYAAQRGGTSMPAETMAGGVNGKGDECTHRGRRSVKEMLYEITSVYWVLSTEKLRPIRAAFWSMIQALVMLTGIGESIKSIPVAVCFVCGYSIEIYRESNCEEMLHPHSS